MPQATTLLSLAVLFLPGCRSTPESTEWSRFRGPNGQGVSQATALPERLDLESGLVWKVPLPEGHSSPVVHGDRLFLTAFEAAATESTEKGKREGKLLTLCLDTASGEVLWQREAPRPRQEAFHATNSPAAPTPAVGANGVYVFFGDFGLLAYDLEGNERWHLELGPFELPNGPSSSPVLAGDLLVLQVDQDKDSYLLGVDAMTGERRWRTPRPGATHGYSTPMVFAPKGGPEQLVAIGSYRVISYVLATGKPLWSAGGITWQVRPSAVASDDTVFVTGAAPGADDGERQELPAFAQAIETGDDDGDGKLSEDEVKAHGWRHSGGWSLVDLDDDNLLGERDWDFFRARRSAHNVTLAIRPGELEGDITSSAVEWRYERAVPGVASPVLYEGVLYTLKDGGILTAFDADSGAVMKQGRVEGAIDKFYASPVAGDGKIYLASAAGRVVTLRPGKDWEVLHVSELEEAIYATPALDDGRIYVRTSQHLLAFGERPRGGSTVTR